MVGSNRDKAIPLPGSRGGLPASMDHFIIMLEDDNSESECSPQQGRSAVYEKAVARTATFEKNLHNWLESKKLLGDVAAMGEPMAFPMLAITCTPDVAKKIESFPGVEAVIRDTNDMQFVT